MCAVRGTGELKKRSQIESNEILHFRSTSEKSELYLWMQLQVIAIVRQGIEKLQRACSPTLPLERHPRSLIPIPIPIPHTLDLRPRQSHGRDAMIP